MNAKNKHYLCSMNKPETFLSAVPKPYQDLARLLQQMGEENQISEGNSVEIITSGLRKRELLLEDIRQARSFIHIEYFRFGNDKGGREVRDLLIQKAREGVEVRFLNNNWSGVVAIPNSYWKPLKDAGAQIIPFTHVCHGVRKWLYRINHQQHRKVVVIDGQVAYTGGMNLNDNYFFRWRDTHMRITGPAVAHLNASFMASWRGSDGRFNYPPSHYFPEPVVQEAPLRNQVLQLVSDAPESPESAMLAAYCHILDHAVRYVYIQTPYFVPPKSLLEALTRAAQRGVDVRLILPRDVDTPLLGPCNRTFYAECLSGGVRIGERNGAFTHSKTLVADDNLCIIGASNLDNRSFRINYEINVINYGSEAARYARELFLSEMQEVQEWTLAEWLRSRRWYHAAFSRLVRLFAPLL